MDSLPPRRKSARLSAARRNRDCWSDLPLDLTQLIFERLSFADFERAKCVCSSWQSGSRRSQPNNQIPWMIFFSKDDNYCLLFNPEEKEKLYKTPHLGDDFAKSFCLTTHRSWLLMLNRDYCQPNILDLQFNLYILQVLTGERINLPTLISEFGLTDPAFWIDEKTKDYLVIKMINEEDTVSFKRGDNSWNPIPHLSLSCFEESSNLLYKDHKLYCLNNYKLKVFDFSGQVPLLVFKISVQGCMLNAPVACTRFRGLRHPDEIPNYENNVVVTLSGDVLIVNTTPPAKSQFWKFRVFKLEGNKWVKIVSLGD